MSKLMYVLLQPCDPPDDLEDEGPEDLDHHVLDIARKPQQRRKDVRPEDVDALSRLLLGLADEKRGDRVQRLASG